MSAQTRAPLQPLESAFRTSLSRIYHKLHIQRREQLISRLHALDLVEYVHPIATKEY